MEIKGKGRMRTYAVQSTDDPSCLPSPEIEEAYALAELVSLQLGGLEVDGANRASTRRRSLNP